MSALDLYREGRLDEAIELLTAGVRSDPTDVRRRTFLFELLCFAGAHDRAEKQLDVLGRGASETSTGAAVYRAALAAERARTEAFAGIGASLPTEPAPAAAGTLEGEPFESITDVDERIGARLEVFAGGRYLWIPLAHVSSIRMEAPRRLRDLLWIPAQVVAGPELGDSEIGEILLPALYVGTPSHPDPQVRLGRRTVWSQTEGGGDAPLGLKLWIVDGEEVPILEVRELELRPAAAPAI